MRPGSMATRGPGTASCAASAGASTTFPASAARDTNNGQVWARMENLEKEWKAERKMHQRCREELEAEWEMRFASETGISLDGPDNETTSCSVGLAADRSPLTPSPVYVRFRTERSPPRSYLVFDDCRS